MPCRNVRTVEPGKVPGKFAAARAELDWSGARPGRQSDWSGCVDSVARASLQQRPLFHVAGHRRPEHRLVEVFPGKALAR